MEVITLPKDLTSIAAVQVYDYTTSDECSNQQVSLTHNTFSFLLEGNKEVITDKKTISISNSEFLLMKSGHCLMTEKLSSSASSYRSVLLFFSNSLVLEFLRKYEFNTQMEPDPTSAIAMPYDSFINAYVRTLIEINGLDAETRSKLLQVKFEELMLYLVRKEGIDFLHRLLADVENHTSHFKSVIENNKLNRLTLKELAFLSNMSVSTFKREFEKQYQTSPIKWFQDKRLEHAAFLLKNESIRPSDLFEEAGYENLSNFIYAFKTKYGVTPKQYQQN